MFGKKKSPVFAIAVGALAVFGAYSMVAAVKNCCTEKMKMMTNMMKRRDCASACECEGDEESGY